MFAKCSNVKDQVFYLFRFVSTPVRRSVIMSACAPIADIALVVHLAAVSIEDLLGSIEGLLAFGFVVGLLVGLAVAKPRLGCAILFVVPIAMVIYVSWWQGEHPEDLRSTSALDFVFGPFWPSLGAVVGCLVGRRIRSIFVL